MVLDFARLQPGVKRIVLDDHRRLPWRFFGRFASSIAAGLRGI